MTPFGELSRMTQFKDKAGKDREAFDKSVGAVQGLVDACKKIAPDLLGR